jgi:hypothetical protein
MLSYCKWFLPAVLLLPVAAQAPVISPRGWEGRVGNSPDRSPFQCCSYRTQQIHTDLKGTVRTISQIGFRQGPLMFELRKRTSFPARTAEAEFWIGPSDYKLRSTVWAQNFTSPPVRVVTRKQLNFAEFRHPPSGGYPAPFAFVLKFDVPWNYDGQTDFCWDAIVYDVSTSDPTALDSAETRDWEEIQGLPSGMGCIATGRSLPMTLSGSIRSYRDAAKHVFGWQANDGPAYARSTFLFGAKDPARYWPSLCTFQHVDDVFHGIHLFADANGGFSTPPLEIAYAPGLVGFTFHVQAYSLDNERHPSLVPVSATNGLRNEIPTVPPKHVDIVTIFGQRSNTTGGLVESVGMITEFR